MAKKDYYKSAYIGKQLKALMQHRGRVPGDLVRLIRQTEDISTGAVSNWFTSGSLSKDKLAKVAEFLGTDSDALINGKWMHLVERGGVDSDSVVPAQPRQTRMDSLAASNAANLTAFSLTAPTYEALEIARLYDSLGDAALKMRARALLEGLALHLPKALASGIRRREGASTRDARAKAAPRPSPKPKPAPKKKTQTRLG